MCLSKSHAMNTKHLVANCLKIKIKTIALHRRAPNHPSTLNWVDSKRVCIKEGMGCFDIAQQCFRHAVVVIAVTLGITTPRCSDFRSRRCHLNM